MNFNVFKLFDKKNHREEQKGPHEHMSNEHVRVYDSLPTQREKGNEQEEDAPNETQHRIFVLAMLAIALSCVALSFTVFKSPKAHFVVVDMAKLLRLKAATLVSSRGQKAEEGALEASSELAREAVLIRATIERYAATNKVIVVAKGAVFGGNVKEVTDEIEMLL